MCAGRYRWRLDEVAHGLEGDSFFIASKAANFDTLVPSLIGPAPLIDQSWPSAWLVFGCGAALKRCLRRSWGTHPPLSEPTRHSVRPPPPELRVADGRGGC